MAEGAVRKEVIGMGICCVILIKFLNERMAVGGEREAGGGEGGGVSHVKEKFVEITRG